MIIKFENDIFEVNDGNHRLEAFKRMKIRKVKAVLWCSDEINNTKIKELDKRLTTS